LQDAVEELGWFYPPDPSSKKWCTIGGNIACNAGGLRCVKYGVTRDYVVSLKGYLPSGEPVQWARNTRKFSAGYNIRDLWIGSEGTLGVITEATLRLVKKPEVKTTILAAFPTEKDSLSAAYEIVKSRIQPSIMEFLDRLSVSGAEKAVGKPVFEGKSGMSVLLLELDGTVESVESDKSRLIHILQSLTDSIRIAKDEEEGESLWEVRRTCSSAMFELGNRKLNEDIAVPLQELIPLYEKVEELRKDTGCNIAVFGHAGDGNLHVNIMYDRNDPGECHRAETAVEKLMRAVVSLGGTISGEHGIGLAKSAFMSIQFSVAEMLAMKAIKNALDPNNILNPGKLFEVFEPWKYSQVEVQLPWDHKKHSNK
jgi:glycolate oxidase